MPDVDLFRVNKPLSRSGISFEVLLVLAGRLELESFSQKVALTVGDVALLQPSTVIRFLPVGEPLMLSVRFEQQMAGSRLNGLTMRICRANDCQAQNTLLQGLLAEIASLQDLMGEDADFKIGALVYQLMDHLSQLPEEVYSEVESSEYVAYRDIGDGEPAVEADANDEGDGRHAQRLRLLKTYINKNFRQPVTLVEVAKYLDLTPQYLSRFAKKHLGENFIDYLNEVRLDSAMHALCHSDETIAKIAFNSGFPNLSAFSTLFREKYLLSPQQYRHRYIAQAGPGGLMPGDPGRRGHQTLEKAGPDLTTVGFAQVRQQLAVIRQAAEADVIVRLPLDAVDLPGLDEQLARMLGRGVTPQIELLSAPPLATLTHGFAEFIEHCRTRFGEDEVARWAFELKIK